MNNQSLAWEFNMCIVVVRLLQFLEETLLDRYYDTHDSMACSGPTLCPYDYLYSFWYLYMSYIHTGRKAKSRSTLLCGNSRYSHLLASESQTLAVQTYFVIWHARDIGVIGISKSTN